MPGKINPRELRKSYLDRMESNMEKQGVLFFDPETNLNIDNDFLELPREITEVSSKDLGEYLNAYTQQKVYLRTLLGRCELVVEMRRRDFYCKSESLYKKLTKEKVSETAKDRMIMTDEEVKPYYEKYMDSIKNKTMVELSISNIEDIIFMLSREVSRRSSDFNEDRRDYNVHRR